jgi:GT2 family glycosyltransferase
MKDVDVIIPVYDGYAETVACLESALKTIDHGWARLVVVNDCSPNVAITAYLRQLAADHVQLVLLENATNLGFVATANRGMGYDNDRDVILLNSDVEVAGNWLQRLRDAAYLNDSIGSVTPFSNNATLCSFPNICRDNQLLFGLTCAQLDERFAALFSTIDIVDLPTGIGCCMYIRRECLERVGLFDVETFGRGYGEENDWCQRASAAGWRNVQLANCFVYHKGGVSFAEEQDPRIAHAMQILDKRYPQYHRSIQAVIADDPAKRYRILAMLDIFARQKKSKIAFISHKLGGGAQQHIDELASLYSEQALFLQITPEEEGRSVRLAIFEKGGRLQDGLHFDVEREYEKLVQLLNELGIGRVHFHHTMGLHPKLWGLAAGMGCAYDLTIHDYYLVNGNPTLTDVKARYVLDSASDFDARCAEHYPLPPNIDADHWRQNQRLLVENADRVIFPSEDCRRRFLTYYNVKQSYVASHPDYYLSQPYPSPTWNFGSDRPLRVLVLGAISREKGAQLLEETALSLRAEDIEFHLLGYAYRALASAVVTHGPYANKDVYALVARIAPDVVWFPALWPETYSYTLSIALHLGLPVVVPDIGAFRERVEGRAHSVVQKWDCTRDEWDQFWRVLLSTGVLPESSPGSGSDAIKTGPEVNFYQSEYLSPVYPMSGELSPASRNVIVQNYSVSLPTLGRSERLLVWIWRLSRTALLSKLISLIPFRAQRALKRRLSSRPMHDIVRNP